MGSRPTDLSTGIEGIKFERQSCGCVAAFLKFYKWNDLENKPGKN